MVNNAIGSAFESFLEEEGIREEVESGAVKKIIALQMRDRLQADRLTKSELAERLHTSRAAVDRLLDPNNESVTLLTLKKSGVNIRQTVEAGIGVSPRCPFPAPGAECALAGRSFPPSGGAKRGVSTGG